MPYPTGPGCGALRNPIYPIQPRTTPQLPWEQPSTPLPRRRCRWHGDLQLCVSGRESNACFTVGLRQSPRQRPRSTTPCSGHSHVCTALGRLCQRVQLGTGSKYALGSQA